MTDKQQKTKNTGHWSTGDHSTGDYSTGHWSTGDHSTGHYSTGDYSTGHWSTGHYSTGDYSTGHDSTGNHSTGYYSTGYYSTGNYSTGHWSTSNYSTGHFSTIDFSGFGAFNKPCSPEEWDQAEKPNFLYFNLTEWVEENQMTDNEKEENPDYATTGGYLRVYDYKEAFKKSWDEAPLHDREKIFKLPNFDADVFYEISGIDVTEKNKKETINIGGKEYEVTEELMNALKNLKEKKND